MILTVDLAQLADAVFAEAQRHPPRSPGRRAAGHCWIALTIPPAKTITAARNAIASFGTPERQAAALDLMHRLATASAGPPALLPGPRRPAPPGA